MLLASQSDRQMRTWRASSDRLAARPAGPPRLIERPVDKCLDAPVGPNGQIPEMTEGKRLEGSLLPIREISARFRCFLLPLGRSPSQAIVDGNKIRD
jgi:hypothetical protein